MKDQAFEGKPPYDDKALERIFKRVFKEEYMVMMSSNLVRMNFYFSGFDNQAQVGNWREFASI